MLFEKKFFAPAYETVLHNSIPTDKDNNVSNGNDSAKIKTSSPLIKVAGSEIRIEYWESVVGFKGYKLERNVLQLFDIDSDEKINLTILDQDLYLLRNGSVYNLQNTGKFEQYKKLTDPEILKLLPKN